MSVFATKVHELYRPFKEKVAPSYILKCWRIVNTKSFCALLIW